MQQDRTQCRLVRRKMGVEEEKSPAEEEDKNQAEEVDKNPAAQYREET